MSARRALHDRPPALSRRGEDRSPRCAADADDVSFICWHPAPDPSSTEDGPATNGHAPISWRAEPDAPRRSPALTWGADLEGSLVIDADPSEAPRRVLVRGSVWLIVNTAVVALGSFVFWLAAAKLEPAPAVGTAAALFTAMMFVNYATGLGLPILIARYAAGPGRDAQVLFAWSNVATAASSVIGVAVLLALAPGTIRPLLDATGTAAGLVIFTVLVIGISVSVLVDSRLVTLHRWRWVLVKSTAFVVLRFPLLVVRPSGPAGVVLFLCAAVPAALAGYVGVAALLGRRWWSSLREPLPSTTPAAVRFASVNYVGQLAIQGPALALPLIAAVNVTKSQYASFYIAFSVATVVFVLPLAIGQVLLTEGGLHGASLNAQTKLALRLSLAVMAAATIASPLGARFITIAYGASYESAADLLTPLVAAGLAWCFTTMYLTEARVREDTPGTVAISISFPVAILIPAMVLASAFGLAGLAVSWGVGNLVAMLTSLVVHWRRGAPGRRTAERKEVVLA